MRFISVFRKNFREQKRDGWVLGLSMAFAPLFVFLYYLITGSGSTSYAVFVVNQDRPAQLASGETLAGGDVLLQAMRDLSYETGDPLLRVSVLQDRDNAQARLRNREATLLVLIPEDFSSALAAAAAGDMHAHSDLTFIGDLTNPYYTVAAVMAYSAAESVTTAYSGVAQPVGLVETPLGDSAARSEFELYIPGLLVFAVIIMVFQAAMTLAREIEGGRLKRLSMTRLTAFELLGGTSAWLVLVALGELLLTFLVALLCGFRSQGQLWIALLVGTITSFSIIGAGMIVACFSKSVSQAFVIANFPLGLFMTLSGSIFPLPRTGLFRLFGHEVAIFDFLPPTHAVNALNKVFTLGAGLPDVAFEMTALTLLSALYFAAGVILFHRMHLRNR